MNQNMNQTSSLNTNNKFTLYSNLVHKQKPMQKQNLYKKICMIMTYIYIMVLIFIFIKKIAQDTPNETFTKQAIQIDSNLYQQSSKEDNFIVTINAHTINDPRIVINQKYSPKNEQNQYQWNQYQRETQEHKTLSLLPEYQLYKKKQLEKFNKLKLYPVKHEKLTSGLKKNNGIISMLIEPFFEKDTYYGIQKILESNNDFIWKNDGSLLTLLSDYPFIPKTFVIDVPEDIEKFYIFGLVVQSAPIAANKTIAKTLLNVYQLQKGLNILECLNLECFRQYSMILFAMKKIKIKRIQIFQRSKV